MRDISQSSAELFDGLGLPRRAVQEVWESCKSALAGVARELSHSVAGILAVRAVVSTVIMLHNYSLSRGSKEVCLMNCKNFSISEKVDNNIASKLINVCLK
jgi:hypothetical protein